MNPRKRIYIYAHRTLRIEEPAASQYKASSYSLFYTGLSNSVQHIHFRAAKHKRKEKTMAKGNYIKTSHPALEKDTSSSIRDVPRFSCHHLVTTWSQKGICRLPAKFPTLFGSFGLYLITSEFSRHTHHFTFFYRVRPSILSQVTSLDQYLFLEHEFPEIQLPPAWKYEGEIGGKEGGELQKGRLEGRPKEGGRSTIKWTVLKRRKQEVSDYRRIYHRRRRAPGRRSTTDWMPSRDVKDY